MEAVQEKVCEYISKPLHGSLARKLHKGIRVQSNEGKIDVEATMYVGDEFLRISEQGTSRAINT